jgi:hypothetical protein
LCYGWYDSKIKEATRTNTSTEEIFYEKTQNIQLMSEVKIMEHQTNSYYLNSFLLEEITIYPHGQMKYRLHLENDEKKKSRKRPNQ